MSDHSSKAPVVPKSMLVPFILVTILFPLWGFANDITNPMVAAFKNILLLTNFESSLVQAAFYGGYALMAIPAAIFIKRFSYKSGILIGLILYSVGCLLFIPSGWTLMFGPFLLAYLIMTSGLSFLETTANPYVLSMGDESTATRRLNLAQAFNPMGSITGMFVASMVILINLHPTSESARRKMQAAADGQLVHAQMLQEQEGLLSGLEETVGDPDFATKSRLLKSAAEDSALLARELELIAEPKADQARRISEEIKSQPTKNKFAAAAEAVAVVLQLREQAPPTEAETRRDELFHGKEGLEMALMLGEEEEILSDQPAFGKTRATVAALVPEVKELAAELGGFYEAKTADGEAVKQAAGKLEKIHSGLNEAIGELAKVPAEAYEEYAGAKGAAFKEIQKKDIGIVVGPYALMGGFLILVVLIFAWKLPKGIAHEGDKELHLGATLGRLVKNGHYIFGVVAQAFYVGVQIMCWTFIIQYAEAELGIAKSTAQNCNILAMVIFVSSRFVCTFLLHYFKPGALLATLAVAGLSLILGTIFIEGYVGLYCLILTSACMSLMFPTIYGIALDGLGDDAKLASAGLILAIGGGCLMPPLQAAIIDLPPVNIGFMELASVRASFFLPALCFVVIAIYGVWVNLQGRRRSGDPA